MMKKKIWTFGILAAALMVINLPAQTTNTPPPTLPTSTPANDTAQNNFVVTALAWGTSIDMTKAYPTNGFAFTVGALWENNVSWCNYIDVEKNFGRVVVIGEMGNSGIAGTIQRVQVGIGYEVVRKGDLRIITSISPGYQRQTLESSNIGHGAYIQTMVTLQKLMAHGAFAEMGLGYDVSLKGQQSGFPLLKVGAGATF